MKNTFQDKVEKKGKRFAYFLFAKIKK